MKPFGPNSFVIRHLEMYLIIDNYSESDSNVSGSAEKQWGIAPNSAAVFLSLGISRTHTAM